MLKAWKLFRSKKGLDFAECLHRAWLSAKAEEINEKRVKEAKMAAGVTEETATWSTWKALGYEVIHGSKALFGCDLIWGSKGDGQIYKARFFGTSCMLVVPVQSSSDQAHYQNYLYLHPTACFTLWSLSTSTPRPTADGICSDVAK